MPEFFGILCLVKIVFLFMDGVGLRESAADNPVNPEVCPTLCRLIANHSKPIDACLGVEGLPPSATGQATMFTDVNMFVPWHPRRDRPHPYGTLADIPVPAGFVRMDTDPGSFSDYVENLPLARPDSVLAGYEEAPSDTLVRNCYQVVDFPLVDEYEQCADVCIRLRAEYLYGENRFRKIHFVDTREKTLRYRYGACRPQFIRYLRKVFAWSNTESLRASLPQQPMDGLAPGDIFVYEKDARPGARYGHAVMVAAVAVDTVTRQKAVLLIQGSTPACDLHVVANPYAPDLSPWYLLEASADTASTPMVTVGSSVFYEEDIRRF